MFIVLYFTLTLQRGVFGLEISYNNLFIIHVLLQLRCNILNNSEAFTSELYILKKYFIGTTCIVIFFACSNLLLQVGVFHMSEALYSAWSFRRLSTRIIHLEHFSDSKMFVVKDFSLLSILLCISNRIPNNSENPYEMFPSYWWQSMGHEQFIVWHLG